MSTSFISHSPSPSTHSHLYAACDPDDLHYHHRSPAPAPAASAAAAAAATSIVESSYPSRCASPLLPMGQHHRTPSSHQTIDPDRLSQQLGRMTNRQSQQSVVHKNYAIPEDDSAELPPEPKRSQTTRFINYHRTSSSRRTMLPRQKSYRISTADPHQSSVRELSSKLKSACRKLNPKRLTRHSHHQDSELSYPEVYH
ncbi:hypothetical protein IWW37_002843 [Coemansia sp. RSA 2050]|nr:hypothetical protein IWW37_002843 [Coemansia sp. RSA 2050]KAJ2733959.1 hypothetical protein IW152_002714 [Coemansia sp. BCRC 34962]